MNKYLPAIAVVLAGVAAALRVRKLRRAHRREARIADDINRWEDEGGKIAATKSRQQSQSFLV